MMCRKHDNMQMMVQMLLVVLGLFCCSRVSLAVKCYTCSTAKTAKCGTPFDDEGNKKDMTCEDAQREYGVCFKLRKIAVGELMIYFCDICRNVVNKSEQ